MCGQELEPAAAAIAGAADGTLKVWDRRKLGQEGSPQALFSLALHKQAIMRVEFMPTAPGQPSLVPSFCTLQATVAAPQLGCVR